MSRTLVWEEHALNELRRLRVLDPTGAKECLAAIRGLIDEPEPTGVSALGGSGYFRLPVGSWRVLYRVVESEVTVYVIKIGRVA